MGTPPEAEGAHVDYFPASSSTDETANGRPAPTATVSPDVRLPTTAATVAQWVATWLKMCADGDLILGPLNDDDEARRTYDLSAKQLRNIRNAAMSGALRQRARQLNVPLPAGYIDRPAMREDEQMRAA